MPTYMDYLKVSEQLVERASARLAENDNKAAIDAILTALVAINSALRVAKEQGAVG